MGFSKHCTINYIYITTNVGLMDSVIGFSSILHHILINLFNSSSDWLSLETQEWSLTFSTIERQTCQT